MSLELEDLILLAAAALLRDTGNAVDYTEAVRKAKRLWKEVLDDRKNDD